MSKMKLCIRSFWNYGRVLLSKIINYSVEISNVCFYSKVQATDKVKDYLKKPTFDNWQWEDAEMMFLLRQMYIDLGFLHTFNIEVNNLK